jgi:hypothetical protein
MGKIILLNGPPSSGKDTAAKFIREWYNYNIKKVGDISTRCILDRMSMPIKKAFSGFAFAPIDEDGNVHPFERKKEEIIPALGVSYRQWQIDFSEKFIKPNYGDASFGKLLLDRCNYRFVTQSCDLIVVPDCGFQIEIEVLYNNFQPASNILMLQLHREDCTFKGDSRGYVARPAWVPEGHWLQVQNNGTIDEFHEQIQTIVKGWLDAE